MIKGRWEKGEAAIAKKAHLSYLYAKNLIKGPFSLGEPIIATYPEIALKYAKYVLKGPFPLCELTIYKEFSYAFEYVITLSI